MNTITKIALGGALGAAMFLAPLAAMAATISDPLFSNGDTTIDVAGNSTVSGTFTLQVGSTEVCEVLRTQAAPQAFTDTSVGGTLGYQFGTYTNVPFSVKVSPNTGTYNAMVQCAGQYGGNRAVDGNDGIVVGPQGLGTIRVVANSSSSTGGSGNTTLDAILAQIASLTAQMGCASSGGTWNGTACVPKPVTPPASNKCTELSAKMSGAVRGSGQYYFGSPNGKLQTYLLDQGFDIPWLTNGSGTRYGFYGDQTASALASFKNANGCN